MKFLTILALLVNVNVVVGQTPLTRDQILGSISSRQGAFPGVLLSTSVFSDQNSYQYKAREAAARVLPNSGFGSTKIIEYYALACLYYSTNSVSNARTNSIIPGQALEPWKRTDDWIEEYNYCTWYGIVCTESTIGVQEINLANNTLTGEFPPEILFLGSTLDRIDLFANFFHYAIKYNWFSEMIALEDLFFGTTSWDADGIPAEISDLKALQQLDISNSFWRGAIQPTSFADMPLLTYIDMADNFYSAAQESALASIANLPSLTRFYMDNCKFTVPITMEFLSSMPIILEAWMDFTKFAGGIPTSIGNAESLRSLSLSYCGLSGTIPGEIAKTSMDRMWLYANELTGPIPEALALKSWKYLLVEGNGLTGGFPETICTQTSIIHLGADCDICDPAVQSNCCTCCGDECGNLFEETPAPTAAPTGFGICFSGDSEVEVENKGSVKMSSLAVGDYVKVVDNKYEPVYSFGHKNDESSAEFLQIVTKGNRRPLELSKDHMVVIEGGRHVPASLVKRGDNLVTADGDLVVVKTIRTVMRKGIYAPFTASGSIIVNDIAASNYVAFQGSEYLQIAGVDTPFSFHWLAHIFNSVHRVAVMIGFSGESYTETGVSQWVALPHKCGIWLLEQNAVVAVAIVLPSIALFGFVSMIEALMNSSPMVLASLIVGALTLLVARRTVSVKTLKM